MYETTNTDPLSLPVDDTGVNGLSVVCRGPGIHGNNTHTITQIKNRSRSTLTGPSARCPPGSAVCALSTRVLAAGFAQDDASVTDVKLYCCQY